MNDAGDFGQPRVYAADNLRAHNMTNSLRIFISEDEYLLIGLLEEFINDLGHRVAAATCDFDAAMEMAAKVDYDIAVLDVNMAGTLVWPIVDVVKQRSKPVVLTTGYNERNLPQDLSCPILVKPYRVSELDDALKKAHSNG